MMNRWRAGTETGVWYTVRKARLGKRSKGHAAYYRIDGEEHLVGYFRKREYAYRQIANDLCIELQLTRGRMNRGQSN